MGFWVKNAIIALFLIGLGVAFFLYKDILLATDPQAVQTSEAEVTPTEEPEKPAPKAKITNAAAEGLSKFYAKIYGDKGDRKIRNNVIFLPDPEGDLIELLKAREMIVRPYRKAWAGNKISRPFRKGETLYQKISEYSADEGLEVIWWLNKDFIVKDPFRINKDIVQTVKQVGNAVSGHFPEGVNSYFCYRQRTVVLISEAPSYLDEECLLLE